MKNPYKFPSANWFKWSFLEWWFNNAPIGAYTIELSNPYYKEIVDEFISKHDRT